MKRQIRYKGKKSHLALTPREKGFGFAIATGVIALMILYMLWQAHHPMD